MNRKEKSVKEKSLKEKWKIDMQLKKIYIFVKKRTVVILHNRSPYLFIFCLIHETTNKRTSKYNPPAKKKHSVCAHFKSYEYRYEKRYKTKLKTKKIDKLNTNNLKYMKRIKTKKIMRFKTSYMKRVHYLL